MELWTECEYFFKIETDLIINLINSQLIHNNGSPTTPPPYHYFLPQPEGNGGPQGHPWQ